MSTTCTQVILRRQPSEIETKTEPVQCRAPCGWRIPLVKFHDLPPFLRDNEYLLTRHRPALYSFKECTKSIFRIHTETCNIWTHIIGSAFFAAVMLYHWTLPAHVSPLQQKISFSIFYVGAIMCMGMSAVFHTVCCHSQETASLFAKLDYCGIIGLFVTSCVPWFHYGFYCHESLRIFYISLMIILGTIGTYIVLNPEFGETKYKPLRAGMFISLGLTYAIPILHLVILEGLSTTSVFMTWVLLTGVSYIGGGVAYGIRVPERYWPGAFDIWGHSHQILHIGVVAANVFCLIGVMNLASLRMSLVPHCNA